MDSMLDGALSIGVHSDWDQAINGYIRSQLDYKVDNRLGLIIHSALISDYPDVKIRGYINSEEVMAVHVELQEQIKLILFEKEPLTIT